MEPTDARKEVERMLESELTHLRAYIRLRLRQPKDLDEMLSEVTLAVLTSLSRYDAQRPFLPWACGVAENVIAMNHRKAKRIPQPIDADLAELLVVEAEAENTLFAERKEHLQDCLPHLPPTERRLIRQKYYEDIDYPGLCHLSGQDDGYLYVIFRRAHKRLAHCIKRKMKKSS